MPPRILTRLRCRMPPWHLRSALSEVETAESETIEVADAAYRRLRNDLVGLEDDVAAAQNDVIAMRITRPLWGHRRR